MLLILRLCWMLYVSEGVCVCMYGTCRGRASARRIDGCVAGGVGTGEGDKRGGDETGWTGCRSCATAPCVLKFQSSTATDPRGLGSN